MEINSTFYNFPRKETIKSWRKKVPDDFRFIIKVWKEITHKLHKEGIDSKVSTFFSQMAQLEDKISGYLFQFPPWFKCSEKNVKKLTSIINKMLPSGYHYFFEFRNNTWFKKDIFNEIVDRKKIYIVTTYLEEANVYFHPGQDVYYIRLIGDRKLESFKRVQRTQDNVVKELIQMINNIKKNFIFIIVNNHFTGFAPETANHLKELLNLPLHSFSTQTSLSEFI